MHVIANFGANGVIILKSDGCMDLQTDRDAIASKKSSIMLDLVEKSQITPFDPSISFIISTTMYSAMNKGVWCVCNEITWSCGRGAH